MPKAKKQITILIALSICLLGCSKLTAPSPSSSIEQTIDGVYTITYADEISIDPPVIYHILGELHLENGEYRFTGNSEELEHLPVFIYSQLPMIENPSGTYTLSLHDEFKNQNFNDLSKTDDSKNLGTLAFSPQDEPYAILLKSYEGQQTISIDTYVSCIKLWSIEKTIP